MAGVFVGSFSKSFHPSSFRRSFQVPQNCQSDKISADFNNGVLNLCVPKAPETKHETKKIDIKSHASSSHGHK